MPIPFGKSWWNLCTSDTWEINGFGKGVIEIIQCFICSCWKLAGKWKGTGWGLIADTEVLVSQGEVDQAWNRDWGFQLYLLPRERDSGSVIWHLLMCVVQSSCFGICLKFYTWAGASSWWLSARTHVYVFVFKLPLGTCCIGKRKAYHCP